MIHFSRLKLNGFKSFVDRTDLAIEPGLSGVVGPNGCGKSNLVEALRWVMGETSYKRMRGNGMDDVIFNGTDARPQRSFAEVTVVLDNRERGAPAQYNGSDEIEIIRRIEREQGSVYRINGKIARARDVQVLFADMMAGAHSPALVSQGKVTAIINAKPIERRAILEESAGVAGLYARRHEAELRLKAADANLARVQDVIGGMETQLNALKRQSRQATRYRTISDEITTLDRLIAALDWTYAHIQIDQYATTVQTCETAVADVAATVAQLNTTELAQGAVLPDLRRAEADAAARLQAHRITLERLDDEQKRIEAQIADTQAQLGQIASDQAHEKQTIDDNEAAMVRIASEESQLQASLQPPEVRSRLDDTCREREAEYTALENRIQSLVADLATRRADAESAKRAHQLQSERKAALENRIRGLEQTIATHKSQLPDTARLAALRQEHQEKSTAEETLSNRINELRQALRTQDDAIDQARAAATSARDAAGRAAAEMAALERILAQDDGALFKPVLDDIRARDGFEAALSRALGETLQASLAADAPCIWRDAATSAAPSFPAGANPIEPHVDAPAVLKTALQFIGWVADDETGERLRAQLAPGQTLVSKAGSLWRWDGYTVRASAQDWQTVILQQKNTLSELKTRLPGLTAQAESTAAETTRLTQARDNLRADLGAAEKDGQELRGQIARLMAQITNDEREAMRASTDIIKLEETLSQARDSLTVTQGDLDRAQQDLSGIDHDALTAVEADLAAQRAAATETQATLRDALMARDKFDQEQNRLQARLQAIADERSHLSNRTIRAREQLKTLETRDEDARGRLAELQLRPRTISQERQTLMDALQTIAQERDRAASLLSDAESEVAQTVSGRRQAEEQLAQAREARAAAIATLASAKDHAEQLRAHLLEQFSQSPEELVQAAELGDLQAHNVDDHKARREKLMRDRDSIGPVNLRADVEAQEIEAQVGTLIAERDDLTQAIDELRQAISKLNTEARERLLSTFATVNEHFARLFTRLYSGGKAELKLIESDDPLESGLEIMAQPPGKTLQSLSLLSGGEQTLASIALIFAMFLTNPAPICVLDEIDAPLDDANVDRVCSLLEDISQETRTRFLVITHHRMTMSRMNRLYGVTMAERGVSQLISVDLQQSFDFAQAA